MKEKHETFLKKIRAGLPERHDKNSQKRIANQYTENAQLDLYAELEARFEELYRSLDEED